MFYFNWDGKTITCHNRNGDVWCYQLPVVYPEKLIDYFEREFLGGRFKLDNNWKHVTYYRGRS